MKSILQSTSNHLIENPTFEGDDDDDDDDDNDDGDDGDDDDSDKKDSDDESSTHSLENPKEDVGKGQNAKHCASDLDWLKSKASKNKVCFCS